MCWFSQGEFFTSFSYLGKHEILASHSPKKVAHPTVENKKGWSLYFAMWRSSSFLHREMLVSN